MTELKDLETKAVPNWCPGCGNFGIQNAIKKAIVNLNLEPHNVCIVTGIGCGSKITFWINTYGFNSIHGRSLPVASAVKLANPELTVIVVGGDGDGYGIGMGHFVHAMRRNIDITYIVDNNQIYGLTKGQTSPTSEKGTKTKSTPFGVIEKPVNPLSLALSADATYVSRGYAGELEHLTKLIENGINHKGFALIDTFQPCVTFNKVNTYEFFQKRVSKLEEDSSYDPTNKLKAFEKCNSDTDEYLPIGLFYKEDRKTYSEEETGLEKGPIVKHDISNIDITPLMEKFM